MNRDLVHMIENPTRRMQRLGFLKYLVARSARSATSNIHVLGNDLISTVSKKVSVPFSPELVKYFAAIFKSQTSKSSLKRFEATTRQYIPESIASVELQDAYLASDSLPSKRGRLVSADWRNYPYLALALELIRKESFSLLVRGQVLLKLISPEELKAFADYSPNNNPLVLTMAQRLFFLISFIESDQHILIPLYRVLLHREGEFTDWEVGDLFPDIMRELHQQLRPSVRSGADALHLQKLLEKAKLIEQWRGKRYKGKGARDEAATIRLEPFVDLGILTKSDPFSYRYEFTPAGRCLMADLINSEHISAYLDNQFFNQVNKAYDLSAPHVSDSNLVLNAIYGSFSSLASPLGYAPIRDVLLLAAISMIDSGKGYFEMSEGFKTLQETQRKAPDIVRFNVDRWGNVTFVKFLRSP